MEDDGEMNLLRIWMQAWRISTKIEDTAAGTDEMNEGDTEDFEEEPSNII